MPGNEPTSEEADDAGHPDNAESSAPDGASSRQPAESELSALEDVDLSAVDGVELSAFDDVELSALDDAELTAAQVGCLCRGSDLIELLARRHAMAVICAVGALGPARYRELETALGDASSSTLSNRLAELTDADLLERRRYDEIPPRVEYELTSDGTVLQTLLVALLVWAERRERADG